MTKYTLILLTLILISCSTKKDNKVDFYYVIKHFDATKQDTKDKFAPPPPPKMFYGLHNFILLSSKIFYHNNNIIRRCGVGIDYTKPPRLYITPDSLIEIKISELENFLKINIPDSLYNGYNVSAIISSPTDTIRNTTFNIIKEYFVEKNIKHGIRNLTEEEDFVLNAKIKKEKYNPENQNFKIGFDIQFEPPSDISNEK
jgi:hypothetical protein